MLLLTESRAAKYQIAGNLIPQQLMTCQKITGTFCLPQQKMCAACLHTSQILYHVRESEERFWGRKKTPAAGLETSKSLHHARKSEERFGGLKEGACGRLTDFKKLMTCHKSLGSHLLPRKWARADGKTSPSSLHIRKSQDHLFHQIRSACGRTPRPHEEEQRRNKDKIYVTIKLK